MNFTHIIISIIVSIFILTNVIITNLTEIIINTIVFTNIINIIMALAQNPISTLSHIWVFVRQYGIMFVIIVTRPKPAYGRQGLAGSLGQDTDQGCTFWGVLNVSLRAYGAQLGFKPAWNH